MIAAVATFAFAGAAIVALSAIGFAIAPQWRRILKLASGKIELPAEPDRWRTMHLAADRRLPFAGAPTRGLARRRRAR